jgi:uncharacterized protein
MTEVELATVGVAAIVAGAVSALAGGGTLISFPVLLAVGVPSIPANVTNTIALCTGYLGGTLAERPGWTATRKRPVAIDSDISGLDPRRRRGSPSLSASTSG